MKKTIEIVVTLAICVILHGNAVGQEFTGERIKTLVDQIDSSISRFEAKTAGYEGDRNKLQAQAENLFSRLTQAPDQLLKESLLADILYSQALSHRLDWNYIQATKGTLFELVPRLNQLAGEVERSARMGFTTSAEYRDYQVRLRSFVSNSSQILRGVIQTVDDPALKQNIRDAAIALKSAGFGLSQSKKDGSANINEVQETVRLLENSIAQLQTIENSLAAEKFTLQLEGYRSMVRLVISQLNLNGPLAMDKLPSFVDKCVSQIRDRNGRLNSAVGQVEGIDPSFGNADYLTKQELDAIIDELSE